MPTSSRILFNDKNYIITVLTTILLLLRSLPPSKVFDFCHLPHQREACCNVFALKRRQSNKYLLTVRCRHRTLHCFDKFGKAPLVRGCGCPADTFAQQKHRPSRQARPVLIDKIFRKAPLARGAGTECD